MSIDDLTTTADGRDTREFVARLEAEAVRRLAELPGEQRAGCVSSDLVAVHTALSRVLQRDLNRGLVFCEWGSGSGGVCAVAASLGFETSGIEILPELAEASRELLADMGLEANIAIGSFLMSGDGDLIEDCEHTQGVATTAGYDELGLDLADCDVIFAYPWPGEENAFDRVFGRHATPGALLVTYHDLARVLVQRHTGDPEELQSLGWLGEP